MNFNRRDFFAITGSTIASFGLGACRRSEGSDSPNDGRLTARPHGSVKTSASGRITLDLDRERNALLELPKSEGTSRIPLLVFLHGAGQSAEDMFWYLGSVHEEAGIAVLAPNACDHTWDALGDRFGSDVKFLNRALERVFDTVAIDPVRIAVGGFSDGATYAISLGLINGDLFSRVLAFSPGFVVEGAPHGKPRFFISHGTEDHILPINRCSRRIVAELRARGYDVTFREFEGDHEIPGEVAREGMLWAALPPSQQQSFHNLYRWWDSTET